MSGRSSEVVRINRPRAAAAPHGPQPAARQSESGDGRGGGA